MKNKILHIIFGLVTVLCLSSCMTDAFGQEVILSSEDGSVIVSFGTPYYIDGSIYYYFYNNRYYYPYYIDGRVYYHSYARPLPRPEYRHHPTPIPHYNPRHHGYTPSHRQGHIGGSFGNSSSRPSTSMHQRPSGGMSHGQTPRGRR